MRVQGDKRIHRADIDGLRTVAVLPVVAFHIGLHAARGGFIGVDVFFVISGFLITQLIFEEIGSDRFSIFAFYERRIRRILPALLAALLAVYLLGLGYCLPGDLVDLSKSLIAAALSASNIYFWLGSGYFDHEAISKPLLHTWSLAVEEQFYVFWPVFLFLGHRFLRKRLILATVILSALSLAASAVGAFKFPSATFYLPFTRFWELSLGGLLALGAVPWILGTVARNILAAVGLLLITASVLLIKSNMPFPGLLALPPCLGATMIILAGRDGDTLVGRLLSLRPMVFIGLISYSLYLWHWPITVFQKNYGFLLSGLSEPQTKLLIVGTSIAAAFVSWKFIEMPFRSGPRRPTSNQLLIITGTGTALLAALGIIAWTANGFSMRYSPRELHAASYIDYDSRSAFRYGRCFLSEPLQEWHLAPECLAVSTSKPNYLLLGDSHAADLWFGLVTTVTNVNFLQVTAADCYPTVTHNFRESSKCTDIMSMVFDDLLVHQHVDRIFLSARWKAGSLNNLAATLQWMTQHNISVTLFGPVPLYDSPVPRLLVSAIHRSDLELPQRHRDESMRALDATMRQLAKSQGVEYFSMIDLFCSSNSCAVQDANGSPFIYDEEHFTAEGSVFAAKQLVGATKTW